MAKLVLVGLEQPSAAQICRATASDSYADISFAGGGPAGGLALLRRVRESRATLSFVVVTAISKTIEWLDALEADATDCCSMPVDTGQFKRVMETAPLRPRFPTARSEAINAIRRVRVPSQFCADGSS